MATSFKAKDVQAAHFYLYPAEVPALQSLALLPRKDAVVVNVGAGFGTSGVAFLECREDITLYTVDIENGESPTGSLAIERRAIEKAGLSHLHGTRWNQLHGDSAKVGGWWKTNAIKEHRLVDMVFIDADHSYEACRDDIKAWVPNVKKGGIIAVHDYGKKDVPEHPRGPISNPFQGVDWAVNELLLPNHTLIMRVESLIAFRV